MGICNEKLATQDITNYKSFLSVEQYKHIPIVSLEQAIEPLVSQMPKIQTYVQLVKRKCLNPVDGLTSDESASIMLYSIIWQPHGECLYYILNSLLLSLNEAKLQAWLLYLKLLFSALIHLPSNHSIVYRGNKINLSKQYRINDIIVWCDLPICTTSIGYLESEPCLGNKEVRTIFTIQSNTVRNIHKHCYFQSNNYLLFLPATKFHVVKCSNQNSDRSCFIALQEIESSFLLRSIDDVITNIPRQISSNIVQRCWLSLKTLRSQSSFLTNHYHNSLLEQSITNQKNFWTTDLDKQNLTDRDMKIIVKFVLLRNRCKRIRLGKNHFTPYGISILSDGLYNNMTLTSLDLRNNQLSDLCVQFLAISIIYSNIETLNLESNNITADGALYIAQIIQYSRTLAELYLSNNHLGDQGVKHLANALSTVNLTIEKKSNDDILADDQTNLQHIYLGHNGITDEGLKYLCDMLKINRKLTWLWLTGNDISDRGVKFLSNILVDPNVILDSLFLDSNKLITDASVDHLIYILQRNHTLKTFYINNCNFSEKTKVKLLKLMKTNQDFDLEV